LHASGARDRRRRHLWPCAQVYMLINISVAAYIVGSITLVVTKGDEARATRRRYMKNLSDFIDINKLQEKIDSRGHLPYRERHFASHHRHSANSKDKNLLDDMRSHMELHVEYESVRRAALARPQCGYRCIIARL
jgi:hypothetical protein